MRDCYSSFYYAFRRYLHNKHRLLRLARVVRAYVVLGPLRNACVKYYQRFSNNEPLRADTSFVLDNVDIEKVADAIDDVGYAKLGSLPEAHVSKILKYCEENNQPEYWNPHKNFEVIDKISRNSTIVAVARKYLGAEPILWLTQLRWSFASDLSKVPRRKPGEYNFHDFHYDAHDFKSLTAFVYLTDVNLNSGPHLMISGSHRKKSLKDLARISLTDNLAKKIYPDQIRKILGKRGLVFVEDTSCYHKAAACKEGRRLLLSIDYVLRRKVPPEKATSP